MTTEYEDFMVLIDYTNWKGERRERKVVPERIYFGSTKHHKEPQYLLEAYDVEKDAARTYAMASIHSWKPFIPGLLPDGSHSIPSVWAEPKES